MRAANDIQLPLDVGLLRGAMRHGLVRAGGAAMMPVRAATTANVDLVVGGLPIVDGVALADPSLFGLAEALHPLIEGR